MTHQTGRRPDLDHHADLQSPPRVADRGAEQRAGPVVRQLGADLRRRRIDRAARGRDPGPPPPSTTRGMRVSASPGNLGIAQATNLGLRAARGHYVTFMDHDDTFEPDAIFKLAQAAQRTNADLIYSDEAVIDHRGHRQHHRSARPARHSPTTTTCPTPISCTRLRARRDRPQAWWLGRDPADLGRRRLRAAGDRARQGSSPMCPA